MPACDRIGDFAAALAGVKEGSCIEDVPFFWGVVRVVGFWAVVIGAVIGGWMALFGIGLGGDLRRRVAKLEVENAKLLGTLVEARVIEVETDEPEPRGTA